MTDFYIGLHSDASFKSFPDNYLGYFKTILLKEIDLGNIEYNVAVSSLTRYYETTMEDIIFLREEVVREKRSANPNLSITEAYPPIASKDAFLTKYNKYLTESDPIVGWSDDGDKNFTLNFTVGTKKETFKILSNPIFKATLGKAMMYRSSRVNNIYFELADMLGIGTLTVAGVTAAMLKNDKIAFKAEFSASLVTKLQLSQAGFTGTLDKNKTRLVIKLRGKAPTAWADLGTTLLYYW